MLHFVVHANACVSFLLAVRYSMTEAMELIPLPSSVQTHYAFEQIKATIVQKLHQIPNAKVAFKQSYAFARLVCQMIEELVPKHNQAGVKLDKRQIAIDILTQVLELGPLEAAQAARTVDLCVEAGIKRIRIWRKAARYFFSILLCRGAPPLLEAPESDEKA
jgi:hypothetical protein